MSHTDPQTQPPNANPGGQGPVIVNNLPPQSDPDKKFTTEDLENVRKQEKDKLYKQVEAMQSELQKLNDEREARIAEEQRRADEVAEAKRKAEEAELSAKEILERRESDWNTKFSRLQGQMEQQEIIFQKEREFQQLRDYARVQIEANQEKIIPELYDLVSGKTKEEIDSSIQSVIAKSEAIIEGASRMQSGQRSQMQGVSNAGFTPNGPLQGVPGAPNREYTPEEIQAMGPKDFHEKIRVPRGLDSNSEYSMSRFFGTQ